MSTNTNDKICCPPFNPSGWDEKILEWENKKFIRDRVLTFFYMPLNFGKVMVRIHKKVEGVGAVIPDWLCLSDHTSKWNMNLYLAVDKEVHGADNTTLSGRYLSKVYEGNFRETDKWCKDFENYARNKGFSIKKWFMWYTTCPKCAKKYDKNYVVIISEVN